MPDKGADAAGAALGGRTPRRSPGTPALCNQGNDGNCCCSQPLAAEKMGNEWSSEELGSPWLWLAYIISPYDCACDMVPRHDSEDLEGIRVVERGRRRCREEEARDGKKNRRRTGGRTREGERLVRGEGNRAREWRSLRAGFHCRRGAEKKNERGRGEPERGIPLAPRDSKRVSHGKIGQRRLRDGER